jgi:endonuclease-3 related protein
VFLSPIELYEKLFALYGPQGWWPVRNGCGAKTREGKFEVCMGAILTQNTSWIQVEKALNNLFAAEINTPEKILETNSETLANLITPAGYKNQKTTYLKNIAEWFIKNYTPYPPNTLPAEHFTGESPKASIPYTLELRDKLLEVKGVGRETADSILLYFTPFICPLLL